MSEPKTDWFVQCPSTYYSYGARRHCVYESGHADLHYNPEGGSPMGEGPLYWDGPVSRGVCKQGVRITVDGGECKHGYHPLACPHWAEAPPVAYIAGPMTGRKDWNYPAFFKAEEKLVGLGYTVINPAKGFGGRTDLDKTVYMRRAFENVLKADVIFTLRGWKDSEGATAEVNMAKMIGLEVKSCK